MDRLGKPWPYLDTERLTIVPFTLALMRLAVTDRNGLAGQLPAEIPDEWPGPDLADALPWLVEQRQKQPVGAEWDCLIIHTADREVIGDIGFKGGPDSDGAVEIGYSIIPSHRRQGFAYEAARAIVDWALTRPEVTRVNAECLADNLPSIRVLEKLGLRRVDRDGDRLRWGLQR